MNNLIKSILKTAVYLLDQTDRVAGNVRDQISDALDRTASRVSDPRDRAEDLYEGPSHPVRNALIFALELALESEPPCCLAQASGEEIREQIGQRVQDIGERVKSRFSSASSSATGTEGM